MPLVRITKNPYGEIQKFYECTLRWNTDSSILSWSLDCHIIQISSFCWILNFRFACLILGSVLSN